MRELVTSQAAQLDAVAQELTAQRTVTAQTEVRAGLSLVDTKLLTKPNMYSGEHDGKERWATWSFKMRPCYAVMAPRLGELMGSASQQELEIRQDAMTPNDAAHSTNLYYILSLLTDGEALDFVQKQSCEQWNESVASDGDALGTKSALQVPRNAASNPVSEMGHRWLRRDTVVDGLGKVSARLRKMQSRCELCSTICQMPLCVNTCC